MSSQHQWDTLFEKWFGRLITDPGWTMHAVGDDHLETPASYTVIRPHRQVVFRYRPTHTPSDIIACHEICHLFLGEMQRWADHCFEELPDPARRLAHKGMSDALEQAADDLARAFMQAYGDHDG